MLPLVVLWIVTVTTAASVGVMMVRSSSTTVVRSSTVPGATASRQPRPSSVAATSTNRTVIDFSIGYTRENFSGAWLRHLDPIVGLTRLRLAAAHDVKAQ